MEQISKSAPLHNQVYDILINTLLEGEYAPGERIVETKLADKFGVSRAPVREAIRMVIKDGLIVQNGNFLYVYQTTIQDIINVYQCRSSLESLAARLAAKHITNDQLQHLSNNIIETRAALKDKAVNEVVRLNTEFHDLIVLGSQNEQLVQLMGGIRKKVLYMRNSVFRHFYRKDQYLDEHELIYKAIEQKNEQKAEEEMKIHINNDLLALKSLYSEKFK